MSPTDSPEDRMRAVGGRTESPHEHRGNQDPSADGVEPWPEPVDCLADGDLTGAHGLPEHHLPAAILLSIGSDAEIADRVIADLQEKYGELVYCDKAIWHFAQTHWKAIPDEALWLAADRYDGASFKTSPGKLSTARLNKSRFESILACMRPALTHHGFFDRTAVGINCGSGFIRFKDSGEAALERHSPDHRCRHVLQGHWPARVNEAKENGSLLSRLLNGCFETDEDMVAKIDLLGEVAGVAALGHATSLIQPKALVLKGERAENGKSQVLDLLRSLLPKSATSSISPAAFHDRTFTCQLVGKLLNAPDELASGDAIATEVFKQIITGEPMTVRDVYKSAFEFRPVAQHVFATNNLPTFKGGMDRGVRRRLMVLTFNRVIPAEERIEHIGQRVGAEEADLLLDFAVHGASRVIANQGFTEPASSVEALQDWMLTSDPVLSWLHSNEVEFSKNAWTPRVRTSSLSDLTPRGHPC